MISQTRPAVVWLVMLAWPAFAASAEAATYYVSATGGGDANLGTTAAMPWKSLDKVNATTFQPGDQILLRCGDEWHGVLRPKGSGTENQWITLDSYGTGGKPLLRGADKTEIIDLQGQQYWTIQNLATTGGRTGVNIGSNGINKPAVMHGVHLLNLDVSETTGGSEAAILIRPSTSAMDDVLIEGCAIRNVVAAAAIWVHNTVADRVDKVAEYCTRVVIRGNRIDATSDNGIIVSQAVAPLIEHNTVSRCGAWRHTGGNSFAGIFPTYSCSVIVQENEISNTAGVPAGGDSQALSCDQFNSGTIVFQYNYTHDNAGGFLLTTPEAFAKDPQGRCIVRYNISQNDGNVVSAAQGGGTFRIQGKRTVVYNNVFFNDQGRIFIQRWYGDNRGEAAFYNNIFWCPKGFSSNANNNKQGPGNPETLSYDRNVFFGSPGPQEDAHAVRRDPLFVAPGSGGSGRETLQGYQIRKGSPCVGAGLVMPENGGRDFFGASLPQGPPDIGAIQFRPPRRAAPALAPMRLKVVGNKLVTAVDKKPVLLRGVNIASLEFSNEGDHLREALDVALNQWHANVVRLPMAQDRWYGRALGKPWEPVVNDGGETYRALIDLVVDTAARRRAYVILDLHWAGAGLRADQGGRPAQYRMADMLSLQFWKDVATRYKDEPNAIFELYNEPYEISWDVWLKGGEVTQDFDHRQYGFHAVGMQALYDAVRATGAGNVVLINGMEWGYDLSGVLNGFAIQGANIIYGAHPYPHKNREWDRYFGKVSEKYPVLMGEFGGDQPEHVSDYAPRILKYSDDRGLHWTAWGFHPGCSPTLIQNWNFETNAFGAKVKDALLKESQ